MIMISLGQGQGERAEKAIRAAKHDGSWVILENCHLGKSWMPELEKIVLEFSVEAEEINENFRLWLTSKPAPYFPISILQNGVKVTTEPPKGIKANLKRIFEGKNDGFFSDFFKQTKPEEKERKIREFHKLTWSLSYFHAIIQERKKFGALGWNKIYSFNESDLDSALKVLKNLIDE